MKQVAFIRNIMVGRKGLTQAVLTEAFKECGATDAVSFLATGNIIFDLSDIAALPPFIDCVTRRLAEGVGFAESIFVRSLADLAALSALNPFDNAPPDDIYERCITFLPDTETQKRIKPLPILSTRRDVEIFAVAGSEAYSITHLLDGKTGSAGALIEKIAQVKVTTRNWNTIERILQKYG